MVINQMIVDGLVAADQSFRLTTPSGSEIRLCEAVEDIGVFTTLTDDIFLRILHTASEELRPAREIFSRIVKRDLYKIVG